MKAIKHIRAGLLNIEVLGAVPEKKPTQRRGPKSKTTSAAMQFYNHKCSWRELELLIAKNLQRGMVIALTYDDEHLPANRDAAIKLFKKFIRKLRESRRKRGLPLIYFYNVEGLHGAEKNDFFGNDTHLEDHRLHHHFVVDGNDLNEIVSLWEYGYARMELLNIHYYRELAKYMTKEASEGKARPGERTWNCSRNVKRIDIETDVEYYDIPADGVTLTAPEGAIDYTQFHEKNPYGFADCIGARYLLYPKETPPPMSYAAGKNRKRL